jgi:hypothetical protein
MMNHKVIGFCNEIFFSTRVTSIVCESNFRELHENGKIYANHDNKPLTRSRGLAFEPKYFLRCVAPVAAESNSRELVDIVHIVTSDETTSDEVFSMVMKKSSLVN